MSHIKKSKLPKNFGMSHLVNTNFSLSHSLFTFFFFYTVANLQQFYNYPLLIVASFSTQHRFIYLAIQRSPFVSRTDEKKPSRRQSKRRHDHIKISNYCPKSQSCVVNRHNDLFTSGLPVFCC